METLFRAMIAAVALAVIVLCLILRIFVGEPPAWVEILGWLAAIVSIVLQFKPYDPNID